MPVYFCPVCQNRELDSWKMQFKLQTQKSELSDPGRIDTWWNEADACKDIHLLELICPRCSFRATESFFKRGAVHPTPKKDSEGWYIEVRPGELFGTAGLMFSSIVIKYYLDIECKVGARYFKLLRIVNAKTPEELPEDLVTDDKALRLFAKERLETLLNRKEVQDVRRKQNVK